MRQIFILLPLVSLMAAGPAGYAQSSSLLQSVKRNPGEAKALCQSFKQMNDNGQSALSGDSIQALAKQRGLNSQDAEILATYVIGLHCPDVR